MSCTRLFEISFTDAPQVDREAAVIRGVKILGRRSRNGREYSDAAMQQAARLYEKVGVNLNHRARAQPTGERVVEDGIGWLEQVVVQGDGVYGDLHYFRAHPHAELLVEAAQRNPHRFGLSHHAEGRLERKDGHWVVESVEAVRSVDVVQNPATSYGLFESAADNVELTSFSVLRAADPTLAAMFEEESIRRAAEVPLDVASSISSHEQIPSAVQSLVTNLLEDDELDLVTRLRQAHRVLNAHHEFGRRTAPELFAEASVSSAAGTPSGPDQRTTLEDLLERVARMESQSHCRALLEIHHRTPTLERLDCLTALPGDKERCELIESWPENVRPPSRTRPAASPPLHDERHPPARFPDTTREFVAAIR